MWAFSVPTFCCPFSTWVIYSTLGKLPFPCWVVNRRRRRTTIAVWRITVIGQTDGLLKTNAFFVAFALHFSCGGSGGGRDSAGGEALIGRKGRQFALINVIFYPGIDCGVTRFPVELAWFLPLRRPLPSCFALCLPCLRTPLFSTPLLSTPAATASTTWDTVATDWQSANASSYGTYSPSVGTPPTGWSVAVLAATCRRRCERVRGSGGRGKRCSAAFCGPFADDRREWLRWRSVTLTKEQTMGLK